MKGDRIATFIVLGFLFAWGLFMIIHNAQFDKECLQDYAERYCEKNGYNYSESDADIKIDVSFFCEIDEGRLSDNGLQEFFYLDEERESCRK